MGDYMLNLIENYLFRQRFLHMTRIRNLADFFYLINDRDIKHNIELEKIRQYLFEEVQGSNEHSQDEFAGYSFHKGTGQFPLDIQNVILE